MVMRQFVLALIAFSLLFLNTLDAGELPPRLECRLITCAEQYYFILLGAKMQIIGENTLFDLEIAPDTAIPVSKELLDSIPNDEPIDSRNIRRYTQLFHLVHNCHLQKSVYRPSTNVTVLIFMVDSRLVQQSEIRSAHYLTLCAALNLDYAKRHGYDFLFFQLNTTNLEVQVRRFYGVAPSLTITEKDAPDRRKNHKALYNSKVQQFRATPWAKVAVLSYLVKMMRLGEIPTYDFICYMDSDAAFNPDMSFRSVSDFHTYWSIFHRLPLFHNSTTDIRPVGTSVKNASLIFLSDCPLCPRKKLLPNSGVIFARPGLFDLSPVMTAWWNYEENPSVIAKSTAYEQDALRLSVLWKYPSQIALANGEHQMYLQNDYKPVITSCQNQWVCHLIHWYADSSQWLLRNWLLDKLMLTDTSFNATIDSIQVNHTIVLSSLALTKFIENDGYLNLNITLDKEFLATAKSIRSKIHNFIAH